MVGFKPVVIACELWRAVEAQHRISTMVLVDTLDEQALLEHLLEESKPPLQEEHRSLHWLLFTPFRYPPLPTGSRFRSPGDPGVFYGAEFQRTACAELGYWRWRLLMDSPELPSIDPMQQTLFKTPVKGSSINLRQPPLSRQRKRWTDHEDYLPCQTLAGQARAAGIQIIIYESVRDAEAGSCAALLTHTAFASNAPVETQTWTLMVSRERVAWQLDTVFAKESFEFVATRWTVT